MSRKTPLAHPGLHGKSGHRQIPIEVRRDRTVQGAELIIAVLEKQRGAELSLAPGPLQKDYELARDGECEVAAGIDLDKRQREVDPRGNTGRGPDRTIVDEDRIGFDDNGGKPARQLGTALPVRHHASTVEKARLRKQEGARANRREPRRARGATCDPADKIGIVARGIDAGAPGDEESVNGRVRVRQRRRQAGQTGRGGHLSGGFGDDLRRVNRSLAARKLVCRGEHLERPREVQKLEPVEDQDFDDAWLWLKERAFWHNGQSMSVYHHVSRGAAPRADIVKGTLVMQRTDKHLQIGSLLFDGLDQIDLTGPFEILSRMPDSTYRIYAKELAPVRDIRGLRLAPDATLEDAPQLDILHVPGGYGQEALMADEAVLSWVRRQSEGAACVFSVCTGALICGAAGLLHGRRATSHWGAFHLLPLFGAIPVNERVVVDGTYVFAAGVTAGIDGALRVASELRGEAVAQEIQLYMQYAPEPPFDAGTPASAPPAVLDKARTSFDAITARRDATARRYAEDHAIRAPALARL